MWTLRGGLALVLPVVLLLGGCARRPSGVDGDLTDDWPAMPAATLLVPADQACYLLSSPYRPNFAQRRPTVDCATAHNLETVHVGTFTGADADRGDLPPAGGTAMRTAYGVCDKAVRDFLGGDWRAARLELVVTLPYPPAWSAGARWYRCDLLAYEDTYYQSTLATPQRSLRGELTGPREYVLGCAAIKASAPAYDIGSFLQTDCGQPHNAEFAGVWDAPDGPYPARDDRAFNERMYRGCSAVIAAYVSIADVNAAYEHGDMWGFPFNKDEWAGGNRGYRCCWWTEKGQVTRSLKGVGTKGMPGL